MTAQPDHQVRHDQTDPFPLLLGDRQNMRVVDMADIAPDSIATDQEPALLPFPEHHPNVVFRLCHGVRGLRSLPPAGRQCPATIWALARADHEGFRRAE